jgi:hypothetical protein
MSERSLGVRLALVFLTAVVLSGCIPSTRTPERLYPVTYEMDLLRSSQDELYKRYYDAFASAPLQAKAIRNEIIAQRIYAIDVQYTQYETALTREGQEVGFGALTTAEGLSTAATLVTPVVTKSILSAAATGVLAVKGHYDSEILIAQTMRTIQKQMRASRNLMAAKISARMDQSVVDYPLSIALSDIEEYYSAGTLTSGVIDTSTTIGIREDDTKLVKQAVTQAPAGQRAEILRTATPSVPVEVVPAKPVVTVSFGPDAISAKLNDWLMPNGVLNTANRDELRIFADGVESGLQVNTFLSAKKYAPQRKTFARRKGLIP